MEIRQENVSVLTEHELHTALVDLQFVPPTPVTDKVMLDIRAGIANNSEETVTYGVNFYLDKQDQNHLLHSERITVCAKATEGIYFRWPTKGNAGKHRVFCVVTSGSKKTCTIREIEIIASDVPSKRRISGAWMGISHWDEKEGLFWNKEIKLLQDEHWAEMVRAMHEIKMDTIVVQELFRNQMYYGKHSIERDGYQGKAYYPSRLYPGRMPVACENPVEIILNEADKHGMNVFLPVGLYAWFDFSRGSLTWHKEVADELFELYGHHKSFYGWYVSEEIFGDLGKSAKRCQEIEEFFFEFQRHCRAMAPCKPLMLAPNCHFVPCAAESWRKVLEHCDIICPFGFHRMPALDISGDEAAKLMQNLCDDAGSHLWMDMEVFSFAKDMALYPRPIDKVVEDLNKYTNFEEILCYQYPGLMNAPWASRKPGGEATVKLYMDYYQFLFGNEKA